MNNLTQPAYPVVPLQDNFKRLVVPIPGLSKFEHFALEIWASDVFLQQDSAFVNEVGEANLKPYKWKEVDRESYFVYTRFETESETQYDVDLKSTNYVDNDLNKDIIDIYEVTNLPTQIFIIINKKNHIKIFDKIKMLKWIKDEKLLP